MSIRGTRRESVLSAEPADGLRMDLGRHLIQNGDCPCRTAAAAIRYSPHFEVVSGAAGWGRVGDEEHGHGLVTALTRGCSEGIIRR